MTSLTELLAMVEAGAYDRGDGMLKRYSTFADGMDAAGISAPVEVVLMDAFHHGCAKHVLRALVAKEAGDV